MQLKHMSRCLLGGCALPLAFSLSVVACGGNDGGSNDDSLPPDDLIAGEAVSYTAERYNPWTLRVNEEPGYYSRAEPHVAGTQAALLVTFAMQEQQAWYSRIEAINPGQWWPIGRHFVRFIGYHQGQVAVGRVLPVPALRSTPEEMAQAQAGPNPLVMLPGMDVRAAYAVMRVDQLNADTVAVSRYRTDAAPIPENYVDSFTLREGDTVQASRTFNWKIVAFHPAVGDLPPYAEARLEPIAQP